jgi:hypothetical protein
VRTMPLHAAKIDRHEPRCRARLTQPAPIRNSCQRLNYLPGNGTVDDTFTHRTAGAAIMLPPPARQLPAGPACSGLQPAITPITATFSVVVSYLENFRGFLGIRYYRMAGGWCRSIFATFSSVGGIMGEPSV